MKNFFISCLIFSILLLSSCADKGEIKTVAYKHEGTFIYYLIAKDYTVCEVGISVYYQIKVGQEYACHWVFKDKP